MKKFLSLAMAVLALGMCSLLTTGLAKTLPIENWAIREVIQNVEVSPNGKKIALLRNDSRDGNPIVEIYHTSDLTKEPQRFNAKKMEFTSVGWLNDETLFMSTRVQYYKRIKDFNQGTYLFGGALYNIDTRDFTDLEDDQIRIANLLPSEHGKILVSFPNSLTSFGDDDPFANFRPRKYYKLDIKTGSKSLVLKGNDKVATAIFDNEGKPRFAFGYDRGKEEFLYYYRKPGEGKWREIMRRSGFDHGGIFNFAGLNPDNPGIVYVISNHENDLAGLYEFNIDSKSFGKMMFRPNTNSDVIGARNHSNFWGGNQSIVGATYYADKVETHWLDEEEENLYAQLEASIPNAHRVRIRSRSRDGGTMSVYNSGPKDPGSYYLVKNGTIQFIGSHNPLITADDLSDVKYIQYPARDGRMIPGYVTIPKGKGPHPLIVLPHGGPYVPEVDIYDEWSQFLANNGYMVLKPQYRGSLGHGREHYLATWNQHGLAMQDDKDDGALYLVKQGLADIDRLAMFGWSYGGYAALVAVTRTPQVYQCSIAGAPVADPTVQFNYYRDQLQDFDLEVEQQRRSGISPVDEVEKINIPLMFIHGTVDQRVPYEHKKLYEKAVKKAGKQDMVEFVDLELADHFYSTLFFRHQKKLYTNMLRFLKDDCGPGGL